MPAESFGWMPITAGTAVLMRLNLTTGLFPMPWKPSSHGMNPMECGLTQQRMR